jgi:hypothetical protein
MAGTEKSGILTDFSTINIAKDEELERTSTRQSSTYTSSLKCRGIY